MLDKILTVIGFIIAMVLRILQRRQPVRPVEDILPETPVIDAVQEEARKKAEAKFGKRP